MCEDDRTAEHTDERAGGLTRRRFLSGVAGAAGVVTTGAILNRFPERLALASPLRASDAVGGTAYSMAMHIHSSFSEQNGSMDGHLHQAATNAVDVCWWTDHDHRMEALSYRDVTHFTSFSERGAAGQGGAWDWTVQESGPNTSASSSAIVQNPSSPNDPVAGGALRLTAQSRSTALAAYGLLADCHPAGWNYRDNLSGQTLLIDVLLADGWSRGHLELLIATSFHPAVNGAPGGNYTLSYRFAPGGQASRVASGTAGVVTVPMTAGAWHTATLTPTEDIAALWPEVDSRDFALWQFTLNAASWGDLVTGYFDYLRIERATTGQAAFDEQQRMATSFASKYPSVTQRSGLEVSAGWPHLNWFGSGIQLPDYASNHQPYPTFLAKTVVPAIHSSGGLASYNHPFGYTAPPELSQAQQQSMVRKVSSQLLANRLLGVDILEVGYRLRAGVDVSHHLALWDVLSRNSVFLTGNGTTDDHAGTNWAGIHNNWVTTAWAKSVAMTDLLAALAGGRAFCGSLSAFRGTLDLLVDGTVPMGAVSVSKVLRRTLAATATGVPAGGTLQILQGDVDYAGQSGLYANTKVIGSYPASSLGAGRVTKVVDTAQGSFLRSQVLDRTGTVIAASNPVWLLTSAPPDGIPAARQT